MVSKDAQSRARAVILTAARKCLDDVQKTQPELGGEVVVTYTLVIDGDRGHVMTPFVTAPDVPSPTLLECIKQAAQKVTTSIDPAIDKPGKLRVRLPLALNPKIIPP